MYACMSVCLFIYFTLSWLFSTCACRLVRETVTCKLANTHANIAIINAIRSSHSQSQFHAHFEPFHICLTWLSWQAAIHALACGNMCMCVWLVRVVCSVSSLVLMLLAVGRSTCLQRVICARNRGQLLELQFSGIIREMSSCAFRVFLLVLQWFPQISLLNHNKYAIK